MLFSPLGKFRFSASTVEHVHLYDVDFIICQKEAAGISGKAGHTKLKGCSPENKVDVTDVTTLDLFIVCV